MERIVHLDLKGAPLKIPYLEKVLLCIQSWGGTGVLFEWEDTFPYYNELENIGSRVNSGGDGMYSVEEIKHILNFTRENGLLAIQLVQTMGHMEFVLKHPRFSTLREDRQFPDSLCPSRPESKHLVQCLLEQVLEAQPDAEYLHIGADEVWHMGSCQVCQQRSWAHNHKNAGLFLDHIQDIVLFLKRKRPNLTVLMWDDMLRSVDVQILKDYDFCRVIHPVVWDYNSKEHFRINPMLWDTYSQIFPRVWAASAFKGANGSCTIASPVQRYVSNHEAWIQEIKKYSPRTKFAGIILTGWSRFDHYATLCELLPVSLPSLASCLRLLTTMDVTFGSSVVSEALPTEQWPGKDFALAVVKFSELRDRSHELIYGGTVSTWMNAWQVENDYTNPMQLRGIFLTAGHYLSEFAPLQRVFTSYFETITGRRSAEEWFKTFFVPVVNRVKEIHDSAEARFKAGAGVTPLCLREI